MSAFFCVRTIGSVFGPRGIEMARLLLQHGCNRSLFFRERARDVVTAGHGVKDARIVRCLSETHLTPPTILLKGEKLWIS